MDKDVVRVLVSEIEAAFAWRLRAESDAAIKMLDANDALRAVVELIAAAERSKQSARLMHDDRQQELVCIPPDQWRALCAALAACKPEGA